MSQLRRPITSLLDGVSQEAPSLRLTSQCEAQENGYSSLDEGLVKRPASQHLEQLSYTVHDSAYIKTINWASDEQFIVVVIDGDLFVYDLDGVAQTVNFPDGKTYLNLPVASPDAFKEFAAVVVEDIMYISNRTTQVALDGTTNAGGTYIGKLQDTAAMLAVAAPTNGDTYLIVGDGTIKAQGYYMQWNGTTTVWEEVSNPGDNIRLDATTMPHKLTYNSGTGQFTFAKETWGDRVAGDAVTCPDPSFIDRYIKDIFFHRNRLGVLAGEYCVMSESGPNYQNFFRTTATAVLDKDPIDVRAANIRVSKLNYALPFNRQLAIQSESSQFILSTAIGQVLTPSTASLDVSTTYAANAECKPSVVGNSLYFASQDSNWANVREYAVSADSEIVNVAENITAHVPKYIPTGAFKMAMAEDFDTLFLTTEGAPSRIYVYKFFHEGNEVVQSSWSYWELDAGTTILNIETLEDKLYAVVTRVDGTHLIKFNLTDDGTVASVGFPVLLDFRVKPGGTYDAGNDWTTWAIPYYNTGLDLQVIKADGWTGAEGARVQGVTQPTTTTVRAPGDLSANDVYIGQPYSFEFEFSEQFVRKDQDNEQGSPILNGTLHLRNMAVRYHDTGYIRAEVIPRTGADTYTYVFGGKVLGSVGLVIGEPNIGTGTFKFPIVGKSKDVTIKLINDTHVPNALVSAEWTGNFTSKRGV